MLYIVLNLSKEVPLLQATLRIFSQEEEWIHQPVCIYCCLRICINLIVARTFLCVFYIHASG